MYLYLHLIFVFVFLSQMSMCQIQWEQLVPEPESKTTTLLYLPSRTLQVRRVNQTQYQRCCYCYYYCSLVTGWWQWSLKRFTLKHIFKQAAEVTIGYVDSWHKYFAFALVFCICICDLHYEPRQVASFPWWSSWSVRGESRSCGSITQVFATTVDQEPVTVQLVYFLSVFVGLCLYVFHICVFCNYGMIIDYTGISTSDRKVCVFVYLCLYICIHIFVYVYLWINHTSICNCLKFRQWTKTQWLSSFWIFGLF